MKTYPLKLTRAMVINGGVVPAGNTVDLDKATAKDFLRRGAAEFDGTFETPIEDVETDADTDDAAKSTGAKPRKAAK